MHSVLRTRRKWTQGHALRKAPYEDEDRGGGDACTKKHTKDCQQTSRRGAETETASPHSAQMNQLCPHLHPGPPVSRTGRRYISVVEAAPFVVLC